MDQSTGRSRTRRALLSVLVVGLTAGAAAYGTFSAFSATTSNPDNDITTGTVAISDNDSDGAMFTVTGARPGQVEDRCIVVTYTGSLDADVKLYLSAVGAAGQYLDLTVTQGTQASPSFSGCTGFTPDATGTVYTGTLGDFATSHSGYGNGLPLTPPGATYWVTSDSRVYRFRITVQDDNLAQGVSTSTHTWTWESRSR
jgi:hypothetical protein